MRTGVVPRRSAVVYSGLSLLSVPILAACLGGGGRDTEGSGQAADASSDETATEDRASVSASTGSSADGEGVTRTVYCAGAELEMTLGPAVMNEDLLIVPVNATMKKDWSGGSANTEFALGLICNDSGNYIGADGLRLVDFDAGTVQKSYKAVYGDGGMKDVGSATTLYAVFKPVDAGSINVLVPQAGLFVGVPVVRDSSFSPEIQDRLQSADETDNDPEPVLLEAFTKDVEGASDTRVTRNSVTVTLASDVLFAVDSAELTGEADSTLQEAANQLGSYSGGEVTVVGHTDDVAGDAHNQDLSQRRAQAVADRLGQLTDLSAFTVSVSGKGESEPRVPNDTDENRQLNRRVEVILTPTEETSDVHDSQGGGGQLPEAAGPVAKGSEGVEVASIHGNAVFALDEVVRRGGYLVGEVKATGGEEGTGVGVGVWLQPTTLIGSARGENDSSLAYAITGLSLLTGRTRFYPVDYKTARGSNHPLSEITARDPLRKGEVTTLVVVWPDTGEDTVTLDLEAPGEYSPYSNNPFRLTGIPVVEP